MRTFSRIACVLVLGITACRNTESDEEKTKLSAGSEMRGEPITALEEPTGLDSHKVRLGKKLFHDTKLSKDGTKSCASCHDLSRGGVDGLPVSVGIEGKQGSINAPTVFNASLNVAQFWDGRAASLEEQVGGPLTNPAELGSTWDSVLEKLRADAGYQSAFAKTYSDGIQEANVRDAIATFERSLVTTGSPFDAWLAGDEKALDQQQKAGYELFKNVGCVACHQGRNVGGNMYQRFGVLGDYFQDRGKLTKADNGRFNVTGSEGDRYVFRVPSLRFVAHTAPYFHDGSVPTLDEAVRVMARYQLGRKLPEGDVTKIVAFLRALSGPLPRSAKPGDDS
jgi:cytochrome c peroxidase